MIFDVLAARQLHICALLGFTNRVLPKSSAIAAKAAIFLKLRFFIFVFVLCNVDAASAPKP